MRLISILFALASMTACNFHGEVDPDLECTTSCEEDQDNCHEECEETCIEDDDEEACVEDCDTECEQGYDDCSVSCGENE